jgi:hypothetical protein
MNKILNWLNTRQSLWWLIASLPFAFVLNMYVTTMLDESYAASRFPVPYHVAQLSFDPVKIKSWYAALIEQDTMSRYLTTQHIDFLFMASTLMLHFLVLVFVARLLPGTSRWRSAMVGCAVLSAAAPVADALENSVSYIMLANPKHFADGWAYLYSTFAACKFLMFIFAYAAVIAGLAAAAVFAFKRRATPEPVPM